MTWSSTTWPSPSLGARRSVALVAAISMVVAALWAVPPASAATIAFSWSHLKKAGGGLAEWDNPTSLQFGPDGRLYVAYQDGTIRAFTIARNAKDSYTATATETITLVKGITNHDDDGSTNATVDERLLLGIAVAGTAGAPIIYTSSSDPRFGALSGETDLDTNSGVVSRLTKSGGTWTRTDLVRGIPRSAEIHAPNGLALKGTKLYLGVGGFTNHGAPSINFGLAPEYALSAAILEIDLNGLGSLPYDLPTLNDPDRPGAADTNDPFGGNRGLNQALLNPTGPVKVYGSGFRNPYDIVWHTNGALYAMDNGGNQGAGGPPVGEGPGGACTNAANEGGITDKDALYRIPTSAAYTYYQGHPNPTRANDSNTFGGQSPIPPGAEDPQQCDYQTSGSEDGSVLKDPNNDSLTGFNFSTNGIAEYTASNFENAMKGNLLVAQLDQGGTGTVFRVALGSGGGYSTRAQLPVAGYGNDPLDVWALGDSGPFPGTIWLAMYGSDEIAVLEPSDYDGGSPPACSGADDPGLDEDGDLFDNADEIDNQTDPCSAGSIPPDADGDHTSDLNDPNDDNDARSDLTDPFQTDPTDGGGTSLPFSVTWDATDPDPGGIIGTGFSGMMVNGSTDYLTLYDPGNMTVGSAAGVLTIDAVPTGDAEAGFNTQAYGFQQGISPGSGPFTVQARINGPFGGATPKGSQSFGIQLGTGDQDNYVKIVADANGGSEGISFFKEVGGTISSSRIDPLNMPGPNFVDLFLEVDPDAATVQPRYQVTNGCPSNCQAGPLTDLGAAVAVPAGWVDGPGTAVGLIATSRGGSPLTATWESFRVDGSGGGGTGQWETRAPSGFKREELPYVRVGSTFYLTGGLAKAGGDTTRMQAYNPATNTWTEVNTKLPTAAHHIQGVELGGKIYYVGGINNATETPIAGVQIYDPATNTWDQGASLPAARARGAGGVAVYGGKIYFAGGFRPDTSGALAYFDVYDPVADTWAQLPNLPQTRDHFHAQVVNGKLYALSGRNKQIGSMRSKNAVFTFATNTWSTNIANIPTPRAGGTSAVVGDEIYVIGGEGGGKAWDTVEAYDTSSNTWRTLPPMPTARHGMQAIVYQGKIYIAAGALNQGGGNDTDVQEAYVFGSGGGGGDVTPPTAPGTLTASATGPTNVNLSWGPASDAGGIASYQVQRAVGASAFTNLATVGGATLTWPDATVSGSTSYSYRVRACDPSGNCGNFGNTAQVTTPPGGGGGGTELFSDGFESGFAWDKIQPAIVRQSTLTNTGGWAVRATSTNSNGSAWAREDFGAPTTALTAEAAFHLVSKGGNDVVLLRLHDDNLNWVLSVFLNTNGKLAVRNHKTGQVKVSSTTPAAGTWHDLQVRASVASLSSTLQIWLNGAEVTALTQTTDLGTVGIEHVQVGDSNAKRTYDVAFDDVLVREGLGP